MRDDPLDSSPPSVRRSYSDSINSKMIALGSTIGNVQNANLPCQGPAANTQVRVQHAWTQGTRVAQ